MHAKLKQIQDEMQPITKNASGYNYKYADLPYLWDKLHTVLDKLGIAVYSYADGEFVVTKATDGEDLTLESKLPLSYAKTQTPQDLGSAITYFRRYNLLMMFNVIVEDDDGAKAQQSAQGTASKHLQGFQTGIQEL